MKTGYGNAVKLACEWERISPIVFYLHAQLFTFQQHQTHHAVASIAKLSTATSDSSPNKAQSNGKQESVRREHAMKMYTRLNEQATFTAASRQKWVTEMPKLWKNLHNFFSIFRFLLSVNFILSSSSISDCNDQIHNWFQRSKRWFSFVIWSRKLQNRSKSI